MAINGKQDTKKVTSVMERRRGKNVNFFFGMIFLTVPGTECMLINIYSMNELMNK